MKPDEYLFIRENKAVGVQQVVTPSFAGDFSVFAVLCPFPVLGGTTS